MRLKNKKTGGIDDFKIEATGLEWLGYTSLKEFCEDWEDYEEPKKTWFIDTNCVPNYIDYGDNPITDHCYDDWNELGICFETKEEAEKAVEKLKAFKRLRDKGFRFDNWDLDADDEDVNVLLRSDKYKGNQVYALAEDLDLLFGGEE